MSASRPDRALNSKLTMALDAWSEWSLGLTARPKVLGPVEGGRTNHSFRLSAPGLDGHLLLRLNHPDPASLGIDRALEREILCKTAAVGISRPFLHWDPDDRFVVFPWLAARAWTDADLASPIQRARLWPLLKCLGQLELDRPRRNYRAYLHHYWQQLEGSSVIDPELEQRWRQFQPRLAAFDRAPWRARLVHHDLVPANILDCGDRLVLIDWEYAAPGHPDIDAWSIDPSRVTAPFIAELMGWINNLWERLIRARAQ